MFDASSKGEKENTYHLFDITYHSRILWRRLDNEVNEQRQSSSSMQPANVVNHTRPDRMEKKCPLDINIQSGSCAAMNGSRSNGQPGWSFNMRNDQNSSQPINGQNQDQLIGGSDKMRYSRKKLWYNDQF